MMDYRHGLLAADCSKHDSTLIFSNQKIQRLIHIYGTVPQKELDKALEREMWDDGNVHTLSLLFECRADMLLLS